MVQEQNTNQSHGTELSYPAECLHQLIERQAERTPDRIAVLYENESATYRELNQRANQLAHYLQKRGVGPEVLVAVLMERSIRTVVALLAILKAGGAYVPLDSHFPEERLKYMFEDARPKLVLTENELDATWRKLELELEAFYLDRDWPSVAQEPTENPVSGVQPKNLAYVIYTSGSTGRPKGVELMHSSVVNFMESMKREPGIQESDTLLAVTTISFDIAALELFLPLTVGARMVLVSRHISRVSQSLAKAIDDYSATIMQAAPTSWRLLVEFGWKGKSDLKVLCGGEAFPPELAEELPRRVAEVWNMYGPTETTIWSTIYQVRGATKSVPIGRPIANTQIYILDSNLKPLLPGEVGELFIGGDGLARGYLNKPEITAERFLPNPIPGGPSARIYRTGDLARFLPSGELEYQGRVDHQIKIHGVRVEPGEIEAAVMQFPGVKQALVIAREDGPGDKRLVSYLIPATPGTFQTMGMRDFLKKKLPEYLIPSAFISLEAFPLTFNGKIDRKALPDPPAPASVTVTVSEGPRDDVEYRLVTIWESVLKVKPIGLRDNFFDLGGHSLMAARLLSRVEQSLGKELPLESLLDAPTIEKQAQVIRGHAGPATPRPNNREEIPLFYLGGDPTFQPFSKRLRAFHEFHSLGIQASIVRQLKNPYCLREMAGHFVKAIRDRQPEGPYMLGGWCAHGVLALETAQQLREQGQDVALLVLLESINPERLRQQSRITRTIARWQVRSWLLQFEYLYLRTLGREQARDYLSGRLARKFTGLHSNIREAISSSRPDEEQLSRMTPLEALYAATANYLPLPYKGPTLLVRSQASVFGFASDPLLGWEKILGDHMQVCVAAGNHYTMYMEPNVESLAAQVNTHLKAAQERWRNRGTSDLLGLGHVSHAAAPPAAIGHLGSHGQAAEVH
jgi:amino acid adenylation domain-containing protein